MSIRLARIYDEPRGEGHRVLVDRVWPRGLRKDDCDLDDWNRDVAPSKELRKWFGHDPEHWDGFRERYGEELDGKPEAWEPLLDAARDGDLVLLFGAKDTEHNQAVALRDYLEGKLKR